MAQKSPAHKISGTQAADDMYMKAWADSLDLSSDELSDLSEKEDLFFSVDLDEATYRMPFEVLDENISYMDDVIGDFPPYKVYHDLWATHSRDVDMSTLIEKGYYDGEPTITTTCGSFMGDGMSFIHLTLMLNAITRSVYSKTRRPLGQSIGDDLFLMQTDLSACLRFCKLAEALCCKFSKLNSISEDMLTFCEQYACRISDLQVYKPIKGFKNSIFRDLYFLDIIKGSLLAGKSKVKADGAEPFYGQATNLNKLVQWNPFETTKERSKTFLWAQNYVHAMKLGSSMASLPNALGGIDMAVGPTIEFSDPSFQREKLPYYEKIVTLELREFLKWYLLLRGIYRISPKGFSWKNDWEVICPLVENIDLQRHNDIYALVPSWLKTKGAREALSYISKELRLVSFHDIAGELSRQESFLRLWSGEQPSSFVSFYVKDAKTRANQAWALIKSNLEPLESDRFKARNMKHLAYMFSMKTWGLYVSKDDPVIRDLFGGMPNLFIDYGSTSSVFD